MYGGEARRDALDLWFATLGEMSVEDFVAELGYPSESTMRRWVRSDPRHDPDRAQYRSLPMLARLEAVRRVAGGESAAAEARRARKAL